MTRSILELKNRFEAIKEKLDLEKLKQKADELERLSQDPNLWQDQARAQQIMTQLGEIKKELAIIERLEKDLHQLQELASLILQTKDDKEILADLDKEIAQVEKILSELELIIV